LCTADHRTLSRWVTGRFVLAFERYVNPSVLLNLVRPAANDRANGNRAKRAAGGLLTLLPGRQWGARLTGQRRGNSKLHRFRR
jgi:hypothetical protein